MTQKAPRDAILAILAKKPNFCTPKGPKKAQKWPKAPIDLKTKKREME